jgi:hypothetical protein
MAADAQPPPRCNGATKHYDVYGGLTTRHQSRRARIDRAVGRMKVVRLAFGSSDRYSPFALIRSAGRN